MEIKITKVKELYSKILTTGKVYEVYDYDIDSREGKIYDNLNTPRMLSDIRKISKIMEVK